MIPRCVLVRWCQAEAAERSGRKPELCAGDIQGQILYMLSFRKICENSKSKVLG